MAKPTLYSDAMAAKICAHIADQKSLRWIAKQKGMPGVRTMLTWLEHNKEFEKQYNRAREAMAESFASEIVELADAAQGMTSEGVQAAKLQVDARKWVVVKLLPKKYGDRVLHGVDEDLVLKLAFGSRNPEIDVTPVPPALEASDAG